MLDKIGPPPSSRKAMPRVPLPEAPRSFTADPVFLKDMYDLLKKKRSGHATAHIFTQKNFERWQSDTPVSPSYYIFQSDANLITEHRGFYSELGQSLKKDGAPLVMIELGPGSAAGSKTIPFIEAVGADIIYAADSSVESIFYTLKDVAEKCPDVERHVALTPDFNSMAMNIPAEGRRIMVQFGSTLGNIEGGLDEPLPTIGVLSALTNYRRHLNKGDILVLGLDLNQEQVSLDACYSDPMHESFAMGTLERIQEELPVSKEFSPSHFAYKRIWQPSNHLYAHCYDVLEDHSFTMAGEKIALKKGDILPYANSYKFTQEFLDAVYPHASFRFVKIMADPQSRMHHLVLEAV